MEIIPAIDLKGGKCVRLLQGRDEATTEYSNDPVAVAAEWQRQGAKRLHIVNLDGALGRASANFDILKEIALSSIAMIQFGGGLRSLHDIQQAFNAGCEKVVVGTLVIENPKLLAEVLTTFGAHRVVVALDAMNGRIATHGWQTVSDVSVVDLACDVEQRGVVEILYTDIARDGMMNGPDLATLEALAATGLNVIASGGVSGSEDVHRLVQLGLKNLVGVIIGKALYERRILLPQLLKEIARA
jgi:phosphoribosylformimino-5-aminoimidazole carboxamide ribotide isomerase